mgnify:FL=1
MRYLKTIPILFFIYACGGGGSSSTPTEIENPSNQNPNVIIESCSNTTRTGMQKCDLKHDSLDRYYFIYRPANLNTDISVPVLFALHGYGSSALSHLTYTNYFPLADRDNFIVLYPQGATTPTLSSHWNVGGWTSKSTIKDIEFIETIIDLVKSKIQIDERRIYSSGMSNGGYMSYSLACNLGNKIAAIASVTGSMTPETYDDCNPGKPISILQIHGLQDFTVPYTGAPFSKTIPEVIEYWVNHNSCSLEPNRLIKYSDLALVNFDTYENCLNNTNVKLILHPEMGHSWPFINTYNISASDEVWNFVSKYDLSGKIN